MLLAHRNDDPHGVLTRVYDNNYPHPSFDPKFIGFYRYRNHEKNKEYTDRSLLPKKSFVFEEIEQYIPGQGDLFENNDLSKRLQFREYDYMITSCITSKDHMWPVPYVYNNYWFIATHEMNKNINLSYPDKRQFFADILLGTPKPHRIQFFEMLKAEGMLEANIVNFFGKYSSSFIEKINDPAQKQIDEQLKLGTHEPTATRSGDYFVSQHISKPIMENSWITIVAETVSNNDCFFVTEKTAKALMAGRPFIILSGRHALKNLRSLGFRTFSPVINENYDDISNEKSRMQAAFKSFVELSRKDPGKVAEDLHAICDHNRKIMLSKSRLTEKTQNFLENIRTRIANGGIYTS